MAWEWVAPVSAAGGATIGAVTTWLAGRGARRDAQVLAHSERQQQRLADAYIELLEMLQHLGQWVPSVHPAIDFEEAKHPLPPPEQQARVRALVAAFASPEVKKLYDSYHDNINAILSIGRQISAAMSNRREAPNEPDLRNELEAELRPKERELREKITDQIATELQAGPSTRPRR